MVALGEFAEKQLGYVTAPQALSAGLSRQQLARLSTAGAVHRVAQGVYRMVGVTPVEHEDIYGAFLALSDRVLRTVGTRVPPLVVSGESATLLHGIGGYWGADATFISSYAFTTKRADVKIHHRSLAPRDVVTIQGMPVLSGSATVVDLVRRGGDLSIVSDALMDGLIFGIIDLPALVTGLEALATGENFPDGMTFARSLIQGTKLSSTEMEFYIAQLEASVDGRLVA